MCGDSGYEVGIKGYSIYVVVGLRSMFRNAECTFPTAECTFPTAEHKTNTLLLNNQVKDIASFQSIVLEV